MAAENFYPKVRLYEGDIVVAAPISLLSQVEVGLPRKPRCTLPWLSSHGPDSGKSVSPSMMGSPVFICEFRFVAAYNHAKPTKQKETPTDIDIRPGAGNRNSK